MIATDTVAVIIISIRKLGSVAISLVGPFWKSRRRFEAKGIIRHEQLRPKALFSKNHQVKIFRQIIGQSNNLFTRRSVVDITLATQRRNTVPTVDSILQQLDEGHDVKEVRSVVTDLIEHHLHELKGSLSYWEKAHFANAIAVLAWNINSRHQPTTAWLRLCLVDVEKALVPADQRNENYTPHDKQLEALTYEQLIEDINSLRKMGC